MEKKISILDYNDNAKNNQQYRLNYLAVRVGAEHFVAKVKRKMLSYLQKHIPLCFVVRPVINDEEWNDADKKINRIDDACFGDNVLIVAFDSGKGHVPNSPDKSEDEAGGEKAKTAADAVSAVGVPAEFFDNWRKYENKPCRENSCAKREIIYQAELFRAMPEEQGNCLCKKYACRWKKKGENPPPPMNALEVDTSRFKFSSHFLVAQYENHSRSHWSAQTDKTE